MRKGRRGRNRTSSNILAVLFAIAAGWYYVSFHAGPAENPDTPQNTQTEVGAESRVAGVDNGLVVHFIDIGQGDATLIQTLDGNVLIDGGDRQTADSLVQYLNDAGVISIAYVVATHPHSDHIAGLVDVLSKFDVGTVIMPRAVHTSMVF